MVALSMRCVPDLHGEQAALPFFFGSRPCGHFTQAV